VTSGGAYAEPMCGNGKGRERRVVKIRR